MLDDLRAFRARHTWSAAATTIILGCFVGGMAGVALGERDALWMLLAAAFFTYKLARPRTDDGTA